MAEPKKRSEIQKRRFRVILILVVFALAGGAGWVVWNLQRQGQDDVSNGYDDGITREAQTVTYNGKNYAYNTDLTNYVICGIDTRGELENYEVDPVKHGQADAIFMISYNRREKTAQAFAIPRDTITLIEKFSFDRKESYGLSEDHISLQFYYGDGKYGSCELMEDAVGRLFYEIPVTGYCAFNLDILAPLMNFTGDVEVVVPDDSLSVKYPEFQQGATVKLNADNVEAFVRSRDTSVHFTAVNRMNRQVVFMKAMLKTVKQKQAESSGMIGDMFDLLHPFMLTNMSNDIFADLLMAENLSDFITVPGESVQTETFDEYHLDEEALFDLVIEKFYKEVN